MSTSLLLPLFLAALGPAPPAQVRPPSTKPKTAKQGLTMPIHIHGPFDVKLTPFPSADPAGPWAPGRFGLDKQYQGDLEATSQGAMLAAGTEVSGSAGYVAIERVSGALRGRKGSFLLQHSSTMARGEGHQSITVIPDSGTGELAGLSGGMTIIITDGKHAYDFEYALPEGK